MSRPGDLGEKYGSKEEYEKQKKEIEEHKKEHPEAYEKADPTGDLVAKNDGKDRRKPGRIGRWINIAMEGLNKI
ncbi:hypothetical protein ACN47E_001795 [Coniothyrium glycines]